jgi:DNA anti-recombination protein RmuC
VGLGLLGTFIGLIAALTFSTQSLTSAVDPAQIKEALNKLLTTAAAKFYISAAGLVASLVLSLLIKLALKHLHRQLHQINGALQERLLFITEQDIAEQQRSIQQDSLTELRLFNTNIAMKIGDAVRTAVEASNDNLTNRLSEIAESFAKLIDASGEGAGKAVGDAMKGAFDTSLRQAGEAIEGIAVELKELPARLSEAATSIRDAGSMAAQQQEKLSVSIQEAVKAILRDTGSQVADNIGKGTRDVVQGLEATGSAFGESATKIGAFFDRFSGSSEDYMKTLAALSEQNVKLEGGLSAISSQISAAADGVARASTAVDSNLSKLLAGVADVTRLTTETGRTVRESQEAVGRMIETLQKQMSLHIERFNDVDGKLATVFSSIGAHLELQSRQMGEQLTTMDQALARAVNQFEHLVEDLSDVVSARQPAE